MATATPFGMFRVVPEIGSERQVEAARLYDDEHLTYQQIGRLLGVSRQRVSLLVRGGRRFRTESSQGAAVLDPSHCHDWQLQTTTEIGSHVVMKYQCVCGQGTMTIRHSVPQVVLALAGHPPRTGKDR